MLLGTVDDPRRSGRAIQPDAKVRLRGYRRTVDGDPSFVVQNVNIMGQHRPQKQREQMQDQRERQRQQQRDNQDRSQDRRS